MQAGELSGAEAAELLQITERHMSRLMAIYREEGAAPLAQGNRGRQSAHPITQEVRGRVLTLARTPHVGANQSHLRDLLAEREGLTLS